MADVLFSWLCDAIAIALEWILENFTGILGFDFTKFNAVFPFALTAYQIFQRIGLALVLAIAVVHLWVWFFPSDQQNKASPLRIAFSAIIAIAFIFYGNYLLEGIMDICNFAYLSFSEADAAGTVGGLFTETYEYNIINSAVTSAFSSSNLVLYLLALIMIGFSFCKLLLECVERYCILFMLIYASPLASATLASPQTTGIYKKFFSMFLSQCLLVILNMWVLKLTLSMFSNIPSDNALEALLALLMGYSVLRIGAKMDNYLNQLGLNAAITGVGLAGEIAGAGMALVAMTRGRGDGGANGAAGGILGGAKKVASAYQKYAPMPTLTSTVKNAFTSQGSGLIAGAKSAYSAMRNGGDMGAAFGQGYKSAIQSTGVLGGKKTAEQNINARSVRKLSSLVKKTDIDQSLVFGTSLTEAQNADLATYSNMADSAFNTAAYFQEGENGSYPDVDIKTVGATMQGIGASDATAELHEATRATYGTLDGAENISATMNPDGINGSYDKDGWHRSFSIVNQLQYDALSHDDQHAYSGDFKSADGKKYYYKLTSEKI